MTKQDCRVTGWTQVSAVGSGRASLRDALATRRSGLRRNDYPRSQIDTWIGRVEGVEALDWDSDAQRWESRNNALVRMGLAADAFSSHVLEMRERFGAHRIGTVIGTSTSSIGRTEDAFTQLEAGRFPIHYRQPDVHNPHSPGAYVAHVLGLRGPELTISTACASSARVFATAWRWLQCGIVDAVLVGGIDSLCHSVIGGFNSLELTSTERCRPFDARRNGINLGEAAGYALVTLAEHAPTDSVRLAGYGETSDAFHMSQPAPGGEGALRSMRAALARAGIRG
ncbi:MAG: beta-ketoacyl synthase N-terminal-like domain-containing protein, partial [Pseudomonadota bacterium]